MLKMLYFEFSVPLNVKSIKRNMAIKRLLLKIKTDNSNTVKVALSRAMCSSILLVDMGQMALGVQALGSIPRKSNRQGMGEVGVSLQFGGMTVNHGDFIYADNNGIIVSQKALI
jgi:hypothetical protein